MKRYLKTVACFMALLILIQGCSIYKQVSPPYEEAMKHNTKVRVEYPDQYPVKFNRIEIIDDDLYGVKNVKGKIEKILINEEKVEKIMVKDKTLSWIVSIGVSITIIGVLSLAIADGIDINVF
ncbi:hypothetical protein [Aestuariivivens sediminicola]|uniref:hypothetical protein n=1 Tax=Aestuariivivens sediminicola TaxID=2913560 RepID=UPI001F561625|nr:hypothetical protein [Aestuariivivens sediminicola]